MPANVASKSQVIDNVFYGLLIWVGAWFQAFFQLVYIPLSVIVLWIYVTQAPPLLGVQFENQLVSSIVEIAIELVQLGAFSTLIVLFIKTSVLLKIELETAWNILTPRYEEYDGVEKTYNRMSVFTVGFLPDSKISEAELDVMRSRASRLFKYSLLMYFSIQLAILLVGKNSVQSRFGSFVSENISSQLIFAVVGIPIVFANLVNNLRLSIEPTPELGLFFVEVGVPSILFVLGLRNRISYYLSMRVNRAWDDPTILTSELASLLKRTFKIVSYIFIGMTLFVLSIATLYLLELVRRGGDVIIM